MRSFCHVNNSQYMESGNLSISNEQFSYHKNILSLVMIVAGEVTVQLEKAVLKSSFSRLGGLQLDREVNLF